MDNWIKIHPKVKALAIATTILILGAVPTVLSGTATLGQATISVATAVSALAVAYLKSA